MGEVSELLSNIKAVIASSSTATASIKEEESYVEKDLDRELKIEDVKTRQEYNQLLKQNREERKKYAKNIFNLTCVWTSLIFLILILNGTKSIKGVKYLEFDLSDQVLITLITSTTINFFGFFLLVVKYLFNTESKKRIITKKKKNDSDSTI